MKSSLHARLLSSLIFLVCSTIVVMGLVLLHEVDIIVNNSRVTQATYHAKDFANNSTSAVTANTYAMLESWLETSIPIKQYAFAALVDLNGLILSHTDKTKIGNYLQTKPDKSDGWVLQSRYNGRAIQEVIFPVRNREKHIANAHLSYYISDNKLLYADAIPLIVMVLSITLLVLIFGSYLIVRRLVNPINYLTNVVANISTEKYLVIEKQITDRQDEVGSLARKFASMSNKLIKQLDELRISQSKLAEEITARSKAQEELVVARDQALKASKAKSVFLAKVSHDLRAPLNTVIGMSEVLLNSAKSNGDEHYLDHLNTIYASGKQLLSFINEILNMSTIEAGKILLRNDRFSIYTMIQDIVDSMKPIADRRDDRFDVHCTQEVGFMYADEARVRQVLFNIIGNACKFTEHGKIELEVEREHEEDKDWILATVKDTGLGMSHEQLDSIFELLNRDDVNINPNTRDTGLGLTISNHFCKMMGGDISVQSQLGKGSIFKVRLPAEASI